MSLDERFNAAVEIIQKLPKEGPVSTSNEQKLQFYSLFKQATIGDVNTERPGMFSFIEKAKWWVQKELQKYWTLSRDAWKAVEGTSSEDAKEQYIKVLLEMFDKISQVS